MKRVRFFIPEDLIQPLRGSTPSSVKHYRPAPYNYVISLHVQKKKLSNKILVKILKQKNWLGDT